MIFQECAIILPLVCWKSIDTGISLTYSEFFSLLVPFHLILFKCPSEVAMTRSSRTHKQLKNTTILLYGKDIQLYLAILFCNVRSVSNIFLVLLKNILLFSKCYCIKNYEYLHSIKGWSTLKDVYECTRDTWQKNKYW